MRMGFKVSTALTATLAMFVVCFALAAGAAVWILRADRQAIEQLGRDNIERASELSDLSSRLFQARADLAEAKTYMEGGLETERDDMLKRAGELLEAARGSGKRLGENPESSPGGRPLFDAVMAAAQQLEGQTLTPLHKAIQGWNGIEANKLAGPALAQAGERYVKAVDAFQAHARAQGREAVAEAARTQSRAMAGALAVLIAVALLALAIRLVFRRAILRPLNDAGRHFDRIADGNLTGALAVRGRNEIGVLYAAMARMQAGLGKAVAAVRRGVEEIHAGTGEIAEAGNDMSERSARQAEALQEAAASLAQLSATVSGNAEQAGVASTRAREVAQLARAGGQAVDEAVSSMQGIAAVSRRIAEIVGVVDGIAFQTNLLALNAAVEAARAGAQGKGFAVVAGEVRTLAQRSAQAAHEIRGLIDDAGQRVEAGVRQVGNAGQTMGRVVESVEHITGIVAGISEASARQAEEVAAVNRTMVALERNMQENAAMVEQTAAAAGSLADQARGLRQAVSVFTLEEHTGEDLADQPRLVAPRLGAGRRVVLDDEPGLLMLDPVLDAGRG